MGAVGVVVGDIVGNYLFELMSVPDDGAVQQLTTKRSDPTLCECVRDWGPDGGFEALEAFGAEDFVKAVDELAAAVAHQRPGCGEPVGVGVGTGCGRPVWSMARSGWQ